MSDMLQLVVELRQRRVQSRFNVANLDDKLKHVGHLLTAPSSKESKDPTVPVTAA
jgi:hypothetical protein